MTMKFSACIELLYNEVQFIDRIGKAKDSGFDAVEFWVWKDKDLKLIKKICQEKRLEVSSFTGIVENQIVDPEDREKCIRDFKESLEAAIYLDCKHLVIHVNTIQNDGKAKPVSSLISDQEKENSIMNIISSIVPQAEKAGITLCFEPLNTLSDHMGYYLNHSSKAFEIIRKVNSPNLKLLYDIYHMQIMEGNLISTIQDNLDLIAYIHIADVPGRHEPGSGEINYENIYKKLFLLDYNGYVGFEYIPSSSTDKSLITTKRLFKF
ncbi:MAG: TIM barrel protein [Actinobacteria bacterium]|nr:TIM barrel protein [Actinomycetota bacterium]